MRISIIILFSIFRQIMKGRKIEKMIDNKLFRIVLVIVVILVVSTVVRFVLDSGWELLMSALR